MGVEEAREQQRGGDEREPHDARREASQAVARQQQLARDGDTDEDRRQLRQAAPFEADPEEAAREQVHGREHRHVGAAQRDARTRYPQAGTAARHEHDEQDHVDRKAGGSGGEVARGDARAAGDHDEHEVQAVQRPPERQPGQRAEGVEVFVGGEQPHHPAPEQRHAADDDSGGERVVGGDQRIQPRGLLVALDRVRERRPRVLEAAHSHEHDGRELDRDRVLPGGALREDPEQVEAVGDLQRVHARVRRDGRQPEAQHRAQVGERSGTVQQAQRDAPAQHPPQAEHDHGGGAEVAEQQTARALMGEDDQQDGEHDGHRDVRP